MANILIKWPTRSRWKLFAAQFEKYNRMLSGQHDVQFLITADEDDVGSEDARQVLGIISKLPNVTVCIGHSKSKIEAVNADMQSAPQGWEILILASDDMTPKVHGYDNITAHHMIHNFTDLDGALWFDDGRCEFRICTLSIMGRAMYDRFGYIYHPSYINTHCDNEFTDVCVRDGKILKIPEVIIAHDWMSVTGNDQLHAKNDTSENWKADEQNYLRRLAANFPD